LVGWVVVVVKRDEELCMEKEKGKKGEWVN
jgi:hypothetical protein